VKWKSAILAPSAVISSADQPSTHASTKNEEWVEPTEPVVRMNVMGSQGTHLIDATDNTTGK